MLYGYDSYIYGIYVSSVKDWLKIFYFKVKQAKPDEVKRLGTVMSYGQSSR